MLHFWVPSHVRRYGLCWWLLRAWLLILLLSRLLLIHAWLLVLLLSRLLLIHAWLLVLLLIHAWLLHEGLLVLDCHLIGLLLLKREHCCLIGLSLPIARPDDADDDDNANDATYHGCNHPNHIYPPKNCGWVAKGSRFAVVRKTTVVGALAIKIAKVAVWSAHLV